jgi:hypothetical protein
MKCPSCGSSCVATYTHSIQVGRRHIAWVECAFCYDKSTREPVSAHPANVLAGISNVSPSLERTVQPASKRGSSEGDLFPSEADA